MTTPNYEQKRQIRSHMVRVGLTNAQFCKEIGKSKVALHKVLTGELKGYQIRRALAKRIGVPVEELFPDTPEHHRLAA